MSGYQEFALVYDLLTDDISYRERAEYFDSLIRQFGKPERGSLLDLACGTGSLSEEFAGLGYDVIGCDSSSDMLSLAQNKLLESHSSITYLCQPMEQLDLYGTVDCAVCALDILNHIMKLSVLERVFSRVSLFLEPEGVFVFDLNTQWKHRQILANNTFVYDYDEVYLVWRNTLLSDDVVQIDLDFFQRNQNGYQRYKESFCERAYSTQELETALNKAGLYVAGRYRADTMESPSLDTQRIVYVVKKGRRLE